MYILNVNIKIHEKPVKVCDNIYWACSLTFLASWIN